MPDGGNDAGGDDGGRDGDSDRLQDPTDCLQDPTDCLQDRLERLHDHLAATEEVPVERDAGHWLGEAQALVGDLRARDATPETVTERLETVDGLLEEAMPTGNAEADEHVAAARELAAELVAELAA